jgi:hypothetical protein
VKGLSMEETEEPRENLSHPLFNFIFHKYGSILRWFMSSSLLLCNHQIFKFVNRAQQM